MTKKDYFLIAWVIRKTMNEEKSSLSNFVYRLIENLSDAMLKDNPRFDKDKFRKEIYK